MSYPKKPGYRDPGPSKDAADSVQEHATAMKLRVLKVLIAKGPQTRDELAQHLGVPPHTLSPRIAELHTSTPPRVQQTGDRKPGRSGRVMHVWRSLEVRGFGNA